MSNRCWIDAKSTPEEGKARRIRGWGPGGLCLKSPSQIYDHRSNSLFVEMSCEFFPENLGCFRDPAVVFYYCRTECTKIARFSVAAAAIFTAPPKIARLFEAPRCAISSAKKIASEPRSQGIKRAKKLPRVKKSPRGEIWARRGFFFRGFNLWFLRGFCLQCMFEGVDWGGSSPTFWGGSGAAFCSRSNLHHQPASQVPFARGRCKSTCNLHFGRYNFGKVQKLLLGFGFSETTTWVGLARFCWAAQETPHVWTTLLEQHITQSIIVNIGSELHRSTIRLWLIWFSTKGNGEPFKACAVKQTSETLLGLICTLINGDSCTGSTHKKSPETRSGASACLYIMKIQV